MSEPAETPALPSRDNCQMAMLCHLLSLGGLLFPFGNFLGPLVIWLLRRYDHPLVDDQGKESLNFQIAYTIYTFALILGLVFMVINDPASSLLSIGITVTLLTVLLIAYVVLIIIATVQANKGVYYRYPLTFRLIA